MALNRTAYVYRFIDINGKTMYVGESWNIRRRIADHIQMKSGKFDKNLISMIQRIDYITVRDKVDARQHELYYISKFSPYLNKSDVYRTQFVENSHYEKKWKTYRVYKTDTKITLSPFKVSLVYICLIIMFIYICIMGITTI